jgi:soluble lytic murein transglycosylase-like protein
MMPGGFWRWEYHGDDEGKRKRSRSYLQQWEYGALSPARRVLGVCWRLVRLPLKVGAIAGLAFLAGAAAVAGPDNVLANAQLRAKVALVDNRLKARQGELEQARIEMQRLQQIMHFSERHRIPADLARSIYDIARAEGIEPQLAFALVSVESEFTSTAVSSVGAVGLAQVMPSTAALLQPGISRTDLFDRETNLRLGFRYLREMMQAYDGDLRLALLAYNRGPGRVDEILRGGGDPGNGYARKVLRNSD